MTHLENMFADNESFVRIKCSILVLIACTRASIPAEYIMICLCVRVYGVLTLGECAVCQETQALLFLVNINVEQGKKFVSTYLS